MLKKCSAIYDIWTKQKILGHPRLHVYKVIKKMFFSWTQKLICLFSKISLCTASIGVISRALHNKGETDGELLLVWDTHVT